MDYGNDFQKLHQSVPVTTQPTTPEQLRYFSKHAVERNVFKWATTVMQGTHGFLAFAAWTAIFTWIFQNIQWLLWLAPFLAGVALFAMHVIFRATWETFWYDKLDDDPNTDSPIYVPIAIIILLLIAEVNGVQRFLTAQVRPPETRAADHIEADHTTTVASIEQSYSNDKAAIESTYREKERAATLPYDRQIRSARNRAADTPEDRRDRTNRIAALERQRDAALAPVLAAKATALEKALGEYTTAKTNAQKRRDEGVTAIDTHNTTEATRYINDLSKVGSYAWIISVGLLALIMLLSYRVVRINVKSGIIARRNYTILDAHGNPIEVAATAIFDAFKRQWLRFWVGVHRSLSPKTEITSFDGTVIAKPGTYNTFPAPPGDPDEELRKKVADKILREASAGRVTITPELLQSEFEAAKRSNGHYKDTPLGKSEPSPAPSARPAEGPVVAPPQQRHTTPPVDDDEARWITYFRQSVLDQLAAYDRAIVNGNKRQAQEHEDAIFADDNSPVRRLGKRLSLAWAYDPIAQQILVWRTRTPDIRVSLENLSPATLDGNNPTPPPSTACDDDELFKQNVHLFKQSILPHTDDAGRVIGIKYRKKDGNWTTYNYNTVRGQWGIYLRRAQKGEVSQAVTDGLEKMEYAMSLFQEGREEMQRANLQTVTM